MRKTPQPSNSILIFPLESRSTENFVSILSGKLN